MKANLFITNLLSIKANTPQLLLHLCSSEEHEYYFLTILRIIFQSWLKGFISLLIESIHQAKFFTMKKNEKEEEENMVSIF